MFYTIFFQRFMGKQQKVWCDWAGFSVVLFLCVYIYIVCHHSSSLLFLSDPQRRATRHLLTVISNIIQTAGRCPHL